MGDPKSGVMRDFGSTLSDDHFGRTGMKRAPLSTVRLLDAGTAGGAFAFLGFLVSRLPRC